MRFIAIIPARFQSSRFPGKPLALLGGKPVIQWVYENTSIVLDEVWVATDDERIYELVESFGGKVIYTHPDHKSGTDRCAEAARFLEQKIIFDAVINVQGDEPFIQSEQLEHLMSCFDDQTEIATLVREIEDEDEVFNPNRPKVVVGKNGNALYFSRSPVPYIRDIQKGQWSLYHKFWSHVGIYAYKKNVLQEITLLAPGKLEKAETLEQLRWLENGYQIKTAVTRFQSIGIDTPADLKAAELLLK